MRCPSWSIDSTPRTLEGNNKNAFLDRLAEQSRVAIQRRILSGFGAFFLQGRLSKNLDASSNCGPPRPGRDGAPIRGAKQQAERFSVTAFWTHPPVGALESYHFSI
ncbi:hypothetical protein THI_1303 [Thiomonas arsenitoxydans]|uniref:Uncharacterized protein n=1 Tax=Thiomonas arsenitoxydans (strain DSM 22701 / CIP 110005 / 3As) TaxID=426114 RepID=D6CPR2_THIA3|nr:hypothetical protein THI_1303 [Thiomonas arsenitoxydans]